MYINYVRITIYIYVYNYIYIYILGWSDCEFHETQDKGGKHGATTLTQQRSTPFDTDQMVAKPHLS